MKRSLTYILSGSAYVAGMSLTITSAWLITMASSQPPLLTLSIAIVGVRFFGIARSVARYAERLTSHKAVFDRLTSLRVRLYSKMTSDPVRLIRDLGSGNLVKKVVDDVERAQEYQLRISLPHGAAIISVSAGVLLGGWIRPQSFVITIPIAVLLLVYIPLRVKKSCEISARGIEKSEGVYAAIIQQASHGILESQLYGYLDERLGRTFDIEEDIWQKEDDLLYLSQRFQFILVTLMGFTLSGLALLASQYSEHLAHVQVTMLIFLPLVMFEAIIAWYPNLFVAGKMLLARKEIAELEAGTTVLTEGQISINEPVTRIEVEGARVAWKSDAQFMHPVTFSATTQECVVLRGRSGTGKSTLALGMLGLLNYEGSIRLNGVELRDLAEPHIHMVGAIQNGHIFNTSLRENLKIASPNAKDGEIVSALAVVELDALLRELPDGLDTLLGAFGRSLSGGEAKRLNLARALLSPASVLVLDEPTEHLDDALAKRIEERILALPKILIIITHSGWSQGTQTILIGR